MKKTAKKILFGALLSAACCLGILMGRATSCAQIAKADEESYDLKTGFCEEIGENHDRTAWFTPWGVEALNTKEFFVDGQGVTLEDANAKLPEFSEESQWLAPMLSLKTYPLFNNAGMTESGGYFNQYPTGWKMVSDPHPESVTCWPEDQGYCSADTTYFKYFFKAGAVHPGNGAGEVVYFTAPKTGNISIKDTLSIENASSDGVYVYIYKIPKASFKSTQWNSWEIHGLFGGSPIFPNAGVSPTSDPSTWFGVAGGSSNAYQTDEFGVEEGDVIAWIYYCGNNNSYDMCYTNPTVTYAENYDSVTLSSSSLKLAQTQTASLKATVSPEDSASKPIRWSSSDESVATVSENGLVTAIADGTATIKATLEGGTPKSGESEVFATCEVTVSGTSVIRITNKAITLTIMQGESTSMTYEAFPADSKIIWSITSGSDVAEVDFEGSVTGLLPGVATIRATIEGTDVYDEVDVTVTSAGSPVLSLSETDTLTVELGSFTTITTTVTPKFYADLEVSVTTDDSEIAEATWENKTITVTGKARGITTLRAVVSGGESVSLPINVSKTALRTYDWSSEFNDPMPSHWENAMISDGVYNADLTAMGGQWGFSWPSKGQLKSLAYRDPSIDYWEIFGGTGVHPLCGHQAAISFIAPYNGTIDFNSHFVSQSGNVQKFQIVFNDVRVYPADSEWEEVSKSHSAEIYLYDIEVKKGDIVRVIVDSGDNDSSDFCFVNPNVKYTEAELDPGIVELSQTSASMKVGEYILLQATVANADYAGSKLTWTSSNSKVASVNAAGEVTANHSGKATITVSLEGGNTATCEIQVSMTPVQISLIAGGSGLGVAGIVVAIIFLVKKKPA